MTGFGRGVATIDSHQFTVEVRSVNHRFLEISTKFPKEWMELEVIVKKLISESFFRGKFDVVIFSNEIQQVDQKIVINWPMLDAYIEAKQQLANKVQMEEKWSMHEIAMLDTVLRIEKEEILQEDLTKAVKKATIQAIEELSKMRQFEGKQLQDEMLQYKQKLELQISIIRENSKEAVQKYRQRLKQRLEEFVISEELDARLLTEVALYAEKIDISEELARLHSHIQQLENTLKQTVPIGRKLDFLMQEIHREINTIGSKNQSALCSIAVVEAKSILEKMREQVQNIE